MKPKRIIDMHHHMPSENPDTYAARLEKIASAHHIEKIVILGLEWKNLTDPRRNADVLTCWHNSPDLVVPFAGIDPDWEPDPRRIDSLKEQGFVGLKFILPKVTYHDESLYPWYARAEELKMPVIFHLGIVANMGVQSPDRVDNNLMRPIYLDTIARAFPNLQIIGAHMGNPWYNEAGMSCRWNANLYFDLSGSTLKKKKPEFLGDLLWWGSETYPNYADAQGRNAWEKIVFGSDVTAEDIPDLINDYERIVETLQLSPKLTDAIFYQTAATMLQNAGVRCG